MKRTFLFLMMASFPMISVSTASAEGHKLVITNFNNDTFRMDIEMKSIGTNGSARPGLQIIASSDKDLGYDPQAKWIKGPANKESKLLGNQSVATAQQTLPVHIIFSGKNPDQSSEIMAKLIKDSPDKLQLSFDARSGESSFTQINTPVSALPQDDQTKSGSLSYRKMEYQVKESAVTIKNLKTGKVIKLSEYIDENFDRSFKTSFQAFFGKKANNEPISIQDTPRKTQRILNFDAIFIGPASKEAREK